MDRKIALWVFEVGDAGLRGDRVTQWWATEAMDTDAPVENLALAAHRLNHVERIGEVHHRSLEEPRPGPSRMEGRASSQCPQLCYFPDF